MKVGDRVKMSRYAVDYLEWPIRCDGTITGTARSIRYDWLVQWDNYREGDTIAHYDGELEVIK